jgi:hypothetical protein
VSSSDGGAVDEILCAEPRAFAAAVRAIVTGNPAALRAELGAEPALIQARSSSPHHATLLHYVAANGIESELQGPVPNADEVAAVLIAAGADLDAPCDAYGSRWQTTLELLVSSDHPTEAGVAGRLVELLCSAGAAAEGPAGDGSPLATALFFGTVECVSALIARGARTDNVVFAAAAGRAAWVGSWLSASQRAVRDPVPEFFPLSSERAEAAEQALVFASMCGQTEVVQVLLARGVNVNANPPGSHWTATPLHTAAGQGQTVVIELLLRHGADLTLKDARYGGTPADWAQHARGPRKALARAAVALMDRHARNPQYSP